MLFSSASDINLWAAHFLLHQHLGRLCHGGRQLLLSQRDTAESGHGGHQQAPARASVPSRGLQGRCPCTGIHALNGNLAIPCVTLRSHTPLWWTCRSGRSCVCPLWESLQQESCWQITEVTLLRWPGPSARVSSVLGTSNSACYMAQWFCEFGWWLTALVMGGSSPSLLPAASVLFVISQNIYSVPRQRERGHLGLISNNNLCNLIQVLKGSCWVPCWCVWSSPVWSWCPTYLF